MTRFNDTRSCGCNFHFEDFEFKGVKYSGWCCVSAKVSGAYTYDCGQCDCDEEYIDEIDEVVLEELTPETPSEEIYKELCDKLTEDLTVYDLV